MAGEAQKAGLKDDEDAMGLVKSFRSEDAEWESLLTQIVFE